MFGITPAGIQLFAFAGLSGYLLFNYWKFFLIGTIGLFVIFSFAATTPKKDDFTIETYIKNGSITKEGVPLLPVPKEFIEDCKVHLKMSEELCRQAWTQ